MIVARPTLMRSLCRCHTSDNLSKNSGAGDFDTPGDLRWNYVGTIDNDATTTEIRFLALVAA
jgi:hypothetical protein